VWNAVKEVYRSSIDDHQRTALGDCPPRLLREDRSVRTLAEKRARSFLAADVQSMFEIVLGVSLIFFFARDCRALFYGVRQSEWRNEGVVRRVQLHDGDVVGSDALECRRGDSAHQGMIHAARQTRSSPGVFRRVNSGARPGQAQSSVLRSAWTLRNRPGLVLPGCGIDCVHDDFCAGLSLYSRGAAGYSC